MRAGPAGLHTPPSVLLMNTHIASSFQDETERSFVSCLGEAKSDEQGMLIGRQEAGHCRSPVSPKLLGA